MKLDEYFKGEMPESLDEILDAMGKKNKTP